MIKISNLFYESRIPVSVLMYRITDSTMSLGEIAKRLKIGYVTVMASIRVFCLKHPEYAKLLQRDSTPARSQQIRRRKEVLQGLNRKWDMQRKIKYRQTIQERSLKQQEVI